LFLKKEKSMKKEKSPIKKSYKRLPNKIVFTPGAKLMHKIGYKHGYQEGYKDGFKAGFDAAIK
jgi:flagellar biosynthesis/type III secretory pathway protein FliH